MGSHYKIMQKKNTLRLKKKADYNETFILLFYISFEILFKVVKKELV